ncbi:arginyl-tRNA synthetase [Cryptotrichosporon argae]
MSAARYELPPTPAIAGVNERAVIDSFKAHVAHFVAEAWGDVDPAKVFAGVDTGKKGADLSVAIPRFKKGKPDEWAKQVVDKFTPNNYISALEVQGAFLLFQLNKPSFTYHQLKQIDAMSRGAAANPESHTEAYGTSTEGGGKHLLVDFSSPNIAKPFHAGHLRSTIIGAVICNLHEASGWKVTRLNYLGDWGTQYGLLSIGFDRYGSEEKLKADPIKHLFDVYVKINAEKEEETKKFNAGEITDADSTTHAAAKRVFKAMEDGDEKALAQWRRFRDLSIEKLVETYARLNVHFDVYWGESKVSPESMQRAIDICQEKKLTVFEDNGALLVDLTKFKLDRAIIRKADGTTIYLTRDLGGAYDKYVTHKFDHHIIITAAAQTLHFKQLNKTLDLMEEPYAGKIEHITFGMVKGMSTRKGTVVFLDDILEDATEVMHEQMKSNEAKYAQVENPKETSAIIGSTAVKIQDMSGKRINDYTFNIKRCTSFEGDFGPFIQYSHVRLCSVQRKNPNVTVRDIDDIDIGVLDDPKIHEVLYHLALYPDAVAAAHKFREPSTLVTWCFRLSHLVGSAWETIKVAGAPQHEAEARLFLFVQIRSVLASAMRMLSLTPIERM